MLRSASGPDTQKLPKNDKKNTHTHKTHTLTLSTRGSATLQQNACWLTTLGIHFLEDLQLRVDIFTCALYLNHNGKWRRGNEFSQWKLPPRLPLWKYQPCESADFAKVYRWWFTSFQNLKMQKVPVFFVKRHEKCSYTYVGVHCTLLSIKLLGDDVMCSCVRAFPRCSLSCSVCPCSLFSPKGSGGRVRGGGWWL